MLWVETKTDAEAIARSDRLWTAVAQQTADGNFLATVPGPETESGQFWGDAIRELANDSRARLQAARRQLPLPGAFREMAIALRAMIREARKSGNDHEPLLRDLHYVAALSSWSLPYNEIAREPGFNVIERTPYATLAALDLAWDRVGCDELSLLNKTDRQMMRQAWGEPQAHTTANTLYHDLWVEGCRKVAAARQARMRDLMREIMEIAAMRETAPGTIEQEAVRPKRSWWWRLFSR